MEARRSHQIHIFHFKHGVEEAKPVTIRIALVINHSNHQSTSTICAWRTYAILLQDRLSYRLFYLFCFHFVFYIFFFSNFLIECKTLYIAHLNYFHRCAYFTRDNDRSDSNRMSQSMEMTMLTGNKWAKEKKISKHNRQRL